jgi:redox-sensitive bicupin YhaK (pirin superfamily)
MIQVFPANTRYTADHGWLKSNFSYSFAEYYDPNNQQFGCMRVLNDDWVAAGKGFGAHPHREMEIVSIVLSGELLHQDNMGHQATTTFGGIQRMSAGTGVIHAELNPSPTEPVTFLQMWFMPEIRGVDPSYERTTFDLDGLKNALLPVVSIQAASPNVASINQDLTIYLSKLEQGRTLAYPQAAGRKGFLFVLEGELRLNGETVLGQRDSARVTDTENFAFEAVGGDAFFMFIDLV